MVTLVAVLGAATAIVLMVIAVKRRGVVPWPQRSASAPLEPEALAVTIRSYPLLSAARPLDELLPPIYAQAAQGRFHNVDSRTLRAAVADALIHHLARLLALNEGQTVVTYDRLSGFGASRYALASVLHDRLHLSPRNRLPSATVSLAEFSIDVLLRSHGQAILWTQSGIVFEIEEAFSGDPSTIRLAPTQRPSDGPEFAWIAAVSSALVSAPLTGGSTPSKDAAGRLIDMLELSVASRAPMSYAIRSVEPPAPETVPDQSEWVKAELVRGEARDWLSHTHEFRP